MFKNIVETCFSIIYKKDDSFIVVHECEEITDSKCNDRICNSFIIYSFCDSKGKIIKQNFSKNLQDKFQLENIEKATKIPLKYLLWVKMNLKIPCFKYELKGFHSFDKYTHSLGFSLILDGSHLVNINISNELHMTKCENIIHYNRIGYNPFVKYRNISIKKSSELLDVITYNDFYNDVEIVFLENFYKDYKIKSKLILIKNQKNEEKFSGDILSQNILYMYIDIDLDLKHKSYYKIKNVNKKIFNLVYIEKGILHVQIKTYPRNFQSICEIQHTLRKLPMSDILLDLIDDVKEKDLKNFYNNIRRNK